jgi:hypothetical protein
MAGNRRINMEQVADEWMKGNDGKGMKGDAWGINSLYERI